MSFSYIVYIMLSKLVIWPSSFFHHMHETVSYFQFSAVCFFQSSVFLFDFAFSSILSAQIFPTDSSFVRVGWGLLGLWFRLQFPHTTLAGYTFSVPMSHFYSVWGWSNLRCLSYLHLLMCLSYGAEPVCLRDKMSVGMCCTALPKPVLLAWWT